MSSLSSASSARSPRASYTTTNSSKCYLHFFLTGRLRNIRGSYLYPGLIVEINLVWNVGSCEERLELPGLYNHSPAYWKCKGPTFISIHWFWRPSVLILSLHYPPPHWLLLFITTHPFPPWTEADLSIVCFAHHCQPSRSRHFTSLQTAGGRGKFLNEWNFVVDWNEID